MTFTPPTPPGGEDRPPLPGPAWQHLPPEALSRLHQPGVVPLRPLLVSDIFSGALQTMRRNPAATIGMALLVLAVFALPSLLGTLAVGSIDGLASEDRTVLAGLVTLVFSTLTSVALTGMIIYVVSEAVLGDRVGLAATWAAVRGRLPSLIGTMLLISAIVIGLMAVILALLVGVVLLLDASVGAILVAVLGTLALSFGLLWLGCRLSLAPAAVVLEKAGPLRALGRSWRLTTGGQGWRVVGISLLAGLVAAIFTMMVQLPILTVTGILLSGITGDLDPLNPLVTVTDHLVQVVVQAFAIPFSAGVTALLYLDQRIRREGLDVALYQAAQARASARQG